MSAQLSVGWWKTAWPTKDLPKNFAAMSQAIKDVKKTKSGLSVIDHRAALDRLIALIDPLTKEANSQYRRHPLDKRKAHKNLSDLCALAMAEKSRAKLTQSPTTVFKKPFGLHLKDKINHEGPIDQIGRMDIELKLMSGFVDELRDKNAEALLNRMSNRVFDDYVKRSVALVDGFVKHRDGALTKKDRKTLAQLLDQIAKELSEELTKVPAQVLRKIGIDEKMARAYTLDKGVSITTGVVGTGIAAAGIAVPGTTPLAIAGTVRSAVALVKDITSLFMSLERKIQIFDAYLVALKKMFERAEKDGKKMKGGKAVGEFTLESLNTVLGIDVVPTVKKANADLKEIEGHLAMMSVKIQGLQKAVAKVIDKNDKLIANLRKEKNFQNWRALFKELPGAEKKLQSVVEDAFKLAERVATAEDDVIRIRSEMKRLQQPGTKVKRFGVAVDLMVSATTSVGGVYDAVAVGKALESVLVAMAATYYETGMKLKDYA